MTAILAEIDQARKELLDLSGRNHLTNYHRNVRNKSAGVPIIDELPDQIYRILVTEGKPMTFLAAAEDVNDAPVQLLYLPDQSRAVEEEVKEIAERHADLKLQTALSLKDLEPRLRRMYNMARTFIEEQGINALYLALGMLQWYESENSQEVREAPLILIPVEMYRDNVRTRFRLRYTSDDIGSNLSLQEKLSRDFSIQLPQGPERENFDIDEYFDATAKVIANRARWSIDRSAIVLNFFRFNKLLMYKDLDSNSWSDSAQLANHPILEALLGGKNFLYEQNLSGDHLPQGDGSTDYQTSLDKSRLVVDADSSQAQAVQAIMRGRSLVIQGPPGTGKSQTITNIIAEAIGQGKSVLFVAEKMAALEVVKRRLDKVGLGDACLELHSHTANKKSFLQELQRTLQLGEPKVDNQDHSLRSLQEERDYLDRYCNSVNREISDSGVTPYQAYGLFLQATKRLNSVSLPQVEGKKIASWKESEFLYKLELVGRFQALLNDMGVPIRHPFWGSRRRMYLPADQETLRQACHAAHIATVNLRTELEQIAKLFSTSAPSHYSAAENLYQVAELASHAPVLSGIEVHAEEWRTHATEIITALENAAKGSKLKAQADTYLIPEAWRQDFVATRQALASHGQSWSRFISREYRRASKFLTGLSKGDLPKSVDEQIQIMDAVIEVQRLQPLYDKHKALLQRLFGSRWHKAGISWDELIAVARWMGQLFQDSRAVQQTQAVLLDYLVAQPDLKVLRETVANVQKYLDSYEKAIVFVTRQADLDEQKRFSTPTGIKGVSFVEQEQILLEWSIKAEQLQQMVKYNELTESLFAQDLQEVIDIGLAWVDAHLHLTDLAKKIRYEGLIERAMREHQVIATFNSTTHQHRIKRFRELDTMLLSHNRSQLLHEHWRNLPKYAAGGLGVLQEQFNRKRGHKSIRALIGEVGMVVQAIKPIFMMSPFSIATFLPPESIHFDLVIFDEASQVKPVDAFGAIIRGKQIVVVGDDKQLPPTSFFDRLVAGDNEDEANIAADTESILGLFRARSAPVCLLSWHYRSRHESLIAISNCEFYDNRLVIFPSPDKNREQSGLVFHYLPTARYVSGDSGGFNDEEAKTVAEAVMQHARTNPNQTLLVATFSQKQRDVIENHLVNLQKADPSCEQFFNDSNEEPFVIKNLENVQGDERDVVLISVGYGRDLQGKLSMNFGPLNKDGGERRLNVLITRARTRCEIFTNLTSGDIDLGRTQARGVKAFKHFLKYAETGQLDLPESTGREADSPFEQSVSDALTEAGYRVDKQIGTGGYRIDLAIVDEEQPGRYLLGIECDGATYHSAQSARDRDRLRQEILENMGWRIHRIWSTDWYRNPQRELARVIDSIVNAKASQQAALLIASASLEPMDNPTAIQRSETRETLERPQIPRYQLSSATFQIGGDNLHQIPVEKVANEIIRIVEIEGPVHVDEVIRRITNRATKNVRERIDLAILETIRMRKLCKDSDFLLTVTAPQLHVRDRSQLTGSSRKVEFIYSKELALAIEMVVDYTHGIKREDIVRETLRLLGYSRITTEMEHLVETILDSILTSNRLVVEGGVVLKQA